MEVSILQCHDFHMKSYEMISVGSKLLEEKLYGHIDSVNCDQAPGIKQLSVLL
jgi:hypothetical protein